jgi:hypothetical protein
MREIKFRAFDEGNKIMHYDFQFIKSGDEGNDWIIFTSDKNKLSDKTSPLQNPYFSQQLKIMQYTGLKDSTQFNELTKEEQEDWLKGNKQEDWKGKEIFEGDIVDIQFDEGYSDDYIEIEEGLKKSYEIVIKKCNLYLASEGQFINISKVDNNFSEIRIIGNRFQNPELKKVYKPVMV